ncbi:MAG: SDR family NAD(P)-dependent oxidoreductase [Lysobacterales bacterium]|nr:SDR family NAD(P)-dependent oxidoreductase [Xanthomonadales bacterium]MCB1613505.1 SDR family NAD(P)-dependent oxidoreductase [Xanthomonadales bacterium]
MSTELRANQKCVLVVGASSGIGKAAAEALAARRHRVYGTSRNASRANSPGVKGVSLEIGDDASVKQAVQTVVNAEGRIDGIFYAAGFYTAGAIEETTPEQVHAQLDAYLVGAHRVTRAVLPHFREAQAGKLLFMSSGAGDSSLPFHTVYSLSKAALQAYCDGLRYEVEPFGIQVGYLQAGGVRTGAKATYQRGAEPVPAYADARNRAIDAFLAMQEKGPVPHAVGAAVAHAMESRTLRPVIRVDAFSKLMPWLKRLFPESIFRAQLRRALGL